VAVFGGDFYDPENLMVTFLIDIFSAKCAVTIFSRRVRKYALISFDYQMIFDFYLLYRITAVPAVLVFFIFRFVKIQK
jgi:hypothetical protein